MSQNIGMNKADIEQMMGSISSWGRAMDKVNGAERRLLYQQYLKSTPPETLLAMQKVFGSGMRNTFGLTSNHRKNISESMKARWAQRKEYERQRNRPNDATPAQPETPVRAPAAGRGFGWLGNNLVFDYTLFYVKAKQKRS